LSVFKFNDVELLEKVYLEGSCFCPVTYINDFRSMAKKPNCELVQYSHIGTHRDVNGPEFWLAVQLLCPVMPGEELYLDYGTTYMTSKEVDDNPDADLDDGDAGANDHLDSSPRAVSLPFLAAARARDKVSLSLSLSLFFSLSLSLPFFSLLLFSPFFYCRNFKITKVV
jgi:hypothetical protein